MGDLYPGCKIFIERPVNPTSTTEFSNLRYHKSELQKIQT